MPLTDIAIRRAKPGATRLKLSDGGGLHIEVSPRGTKTWKLSYRYGRKQKTVSGGRYPDLSLAEARGWREQMKALLREGKDPARNAVEVKRAARSAQGVTFESVALDWHEKTKGEWSEKHAEWVMDRLKLDAFPVLGDIAIGDVTADDVRDLIKRFEERGALEIGRKLLSFVSRIFRYAKAEGNMRADGAPLVDPVPECRDSLKKKPRVKNRAALPAKRMPEFYDRLARAGHDPVTKLALRWTILTWVRTVETRFALPEEVHGIDGKEPVWRISPERMKMNREHLVPLPHQAVPLFKEIDRLRKANGSRWMFPQVLDPEKPISENCMLYCLYDLGYKGIATVHGFRGLASTVMNEQLTASGERMFDKDWIELQLAHDEEDEVRGAYNAAEYLGPRRRMMAWWANWLDDQERLGALL